MRWTHCNRDVRYLPSGPRVPILPLANSFSFSNVDYWNPATLKASTIST